MTVEEFGNLDDMWYALVQEDQPHLMSYPSGISDQTYPLRSWSSDQQDHHAKPETHKEHVFRITEQFRGL
jgi:hypothetical protein